MRRVLAGCAAMILIGLATPKIYADDTAAPPEDATTLEGLDDLFKGDAQADAQQSQAPSLLDEYNTLQEKTSWSYRLYAAAGEYAGWDSKPDLGDLAADFRHNAYATVYLKSSLDLRPWDYLRVHGSVLVMYPTAVGSAYDFGASISEFFVDYATKEYLSARVGRYAMTWGNARILDIVDLPGRTDNTDDFTGDTEILPSWLTGNNPNLWMKAAIPLGHLTTTMIAGLPDAVGEGLTIQPYGVINEYVTGKTSLSLGGYYQKSRAFRGVFMVKTSAFGVDLFVDSVLTFPEDEVLFAATGGLYYQASDGPEIKAIAELRWNGENPGTGSLVPDAMNIAGLSSAVALTWSSIGGSALTLGFSWYNAWVDGSGAVIPALSLGIGRLLTMKAVFPFVYGSDGTEYRVNPPSEAAGYLTGVGVFLVLNGSFR